MSLAWLRVSRLQFYWSPGRATGATEADDTSALRGTQAESSEVGCKHSGRV